MDEYIRKEDAIDCIEHITWYHVNRRGQLVDGATSDTGLYKAKDVYEGLHGIPAADVAPVVHGYWFVDERPESDREVTCSVCEEPVFRYHDHIDWRPKYCPHCGAKMGVQGEE